MPDPNLSRLNAMSADRQEDWKRRNATTYLECAISLMLTSMSREHVAHVLEMEAHMIREFD